MGVVCVAAGAFQANCYFVSAGETGPCVVIDPGGNDRLLMDAAVRHGLQPELLVLTHGHVDHMAAAAALRAAWGLLLLAHEGDRDLVESPPPDWAQMVGGAPASAVDGDLADGQEITAGELSLRVMHTPGHSPGCVCLRGVVDGQDVIFTGDTLFAGSVGRTDLPGGDTTVLEQSLRRLIAATTPETIVYPGHGPATTMAAELRSNPWLQ